MKATKYFVYLDGDDRYDWFDDEVKAIVYAQKNGNKNTRIDKVEGELSDDGFDFDYEETDKTPVEFSMELPKEEPVEVVDDDFDVDFPDIPEVESSDDADYDEMAKQYAEEQVLDTTPADWDDPNRFTEAVNKLEENENEVECKCCFELFPKESCVKTDKGYVCQKCNQELHSHQGTNLDLIDADPFDLNYDDPRDPEEVEEEEETLDKPVNDGNEMRKHEAGIDEKLDEDLKVITDFASYEPWSGAVDTYELIKDAGKLDDLEAYLEECYPDGVTSTQLNDILWFDGEQILKDLGINDEEDEEEVEDEDTEDVETFEALDEYNSDTKSVYHYNCDPSGSEGDIEATSEKEARRKVEDILSAAGIYVPDEIIEITQNTGLDEHINDRPADIESDQENHGVDNAVVDCKKYTLVAHSEDEKPVDCKLEKPTLEEPLAGEKVDVKLYEEADPEFNAKLEAEYNKRLDKYAPKFGYKDGAELKAAMEKDNEVYQEVIEYDDGDNFLDLYLNWWPDEEGFKAEDEYYNEPLRDVLAACLNENLQEAKKDEEELPPDPEVVKLEVHQELNNLVADEIEAIDGYEEVKADIIDKPIEHKDEIIDTINHIEGEEKEHIDELVNVTTEIPFDGEHKEEAPAPVVEEPAIEEEPVVEEPLEQDFPEVEEDLEENCAADTPFDSEVKVGDSILIVNMEGEPDYCGRKGKVEHIDGIGQLHGTWGGCAVIPGVDKFDIITDECLKEEKAKPAGDKKADYEAALKLAAANNKPVIYGYSNKSYNGKYFTLDNPIVCDNVFDETKKFKQKYKSCGTAYVAYPDDYEGLKESYRFSQEEQEKYNCDEDGCYEDNGHWGRLVKCNWCGDFYDDSECKFEADFGWLCDRCQDELHNHGGPLTFIEPGPQSCDEEDELEAKLHSKE